MALIVYSCDEKILSHIKNAGNPRMIVGALINLTKSLYDVRKNAGFGQNVANC